MQCTMYLLRTGISVVLLILFMMYFGTNSVKKYIHGGVVIARDEEKTYNITPPGAICSV